MYVISLLCTVQLNLLVCVLLLRAVYQAMPEERDILIPRSLVSKHKYDHENKHENKHKT